MLYICATPIGNLEDITLRVLRVLKEVDIIAAEDTRQTRKLLTHFQIEAKLVSLHQHNEQTKSSQIIELLKQGQTVALVSDAGTPGISDPGGILIHQAIATDIPITVLPGANAAITGLVQSGLPTEQFFFYGFLPRKQKEKQAILEQLASLEATLIFYEAPHRLLATLEAMLASLGDRVSAVARELTKKYEEVHRATLSAQLSYFTQHTPRGEFVIMVQGYENVTPSYEHITDEDIRNGVIELINKGKNKKQAIKEVAHKLGLAKNDVYQKVLDLDPF